MPVPPPKTIAKPNEITAIVSAQGEIIKRLQGYVSRLEERLNPILRPSQPQETNRKDPPLPAPVTALGAQIYTHCEEIAQVIARLDEITARVEM